MFAWIAGKVTAYVAGGLALAAIVAGGLAWHWHGEVAELELSLRDARDEVQRQADALTSKDSALAALEAAVAEWRAIATSSDDMKQAADRATVAAGVLEQRAAELARAEAPDRANPDCAALLATDLSRVCPAIARGVRERAGAHRLP